MTPRLRHFRLGADVAEHRRRRVGQRAGRAQDVALASLRLLRSRITADIRRNPGLATERERQTAPVAPEEHVAVLADVPVAPETGHLSQLLSSADRKIG